MCINFETSISAFLIGTISGLLLALKEQKEKKVIGLFIMFFSIVQLCEAMIYKGYDINGFFSKLLYLDLGFQGFIFFLLLYYYSFSINNIYLLLTAFIAINFIIKLLYTNFHKSQINTCLTWNFLDNYSSNLLALMYILMFIFSFYKQTNNIFFNSGIILAFTYILSFKLQQYKNTPSIWCLTSALAAPLFLLL